MNKILFILLVLLTSSNLCLAQSLKAYERSAKEASKSKNYSSALAYYKIILEETGNTSIHNYYQAAETARKYRIYNTAENYYQKVAGHEKANEYPLTYFWLGEVLKSQGKYDAAITAFDTYIQSSTAVDTEYTDKARKEINDCGWAKELIEEPDDYEIEHLDTLVNTGDTELGPLKYDNQLYFTSFGEKGADPDMPNTFARLMVSTDGAQSTLMDAAINDEPTKHVAHLSFTEDRKRVYYNLCKTLNASEVHCGIYYRDQDAAGNWGKAIRLPDHINLAGLYCYTA